MRPPIAQTEVEDFHEVMSSIEKNEQMVGKRIGIENITDNTE